MKGKYLITTDNWFLGPDGQEYAGVWGEVEVVKTLDLWGFEPHRPSQNWFLKVGTEDNHVFIAGCQIHYAVKSEARPNPGRIKFSFGDGEKERQTKIYFAEDNSTVQEEPQFPEDKHNDIGFMNIFRKDKPEV